jgi:hypothetical protein
MDRSSLPLFLLLAGCSSLERDSARDLFPLEARAEHAVDYRASLRGSLPPDSPVDSRVPKSERMVEVNLALVELDGRAARRVLGSERIEPSARTVSQEEAQALLDHLRLSGRTSLLLSPRMILRDGVAGTMTVANEVSYVADFEIEIRGEEAVADLVVEVCQDGVRVLARGDLDEEGERIDLEFALTWNDLVRPIPSVASHLPGAAEPVSIETPLVRAQRIATRAPLATDECLVLSCNSWDDPERPVLAFVTAARWENSRPGG